MSEIISIPVTPRYAREDGLTVFDSARQELNGIFEVEDLAFVTIPSAAIGGNHSHPRTEAFIALTKGLVLHWLDSSGTKQTKELGPQELTIVAPNVPHAVQNTSDEIAVLIEYADALQHDVERVALV